MADFLNLSPHLALRMGVVTRRQSDSGLQQTKEWLLYSEDELGPLVRHNVLSKPEIKKRMPEQALRGLICERETRNRDQLQVLKKRSAITLRRRQPENEFHA